jgi:4-carboxymuconolactone decarboxylase
MRLKEPRLQPLPDSALSEGQRKVLNERRTPDGRIYNIYKTLAYNPDLMEKWLTFAGYIFRGSTLPPREREILILRIGWLCGCEYEFGHHTPLGEKAGLTRDEIARITAGPDAPGWDPFEAALLRAADELHSDAFISDGTWRVLARRYDEKQLLDLVMTVGQYNLVSMFLNTCGVQLEEGFPGLPQPKK